MSDTPTPRTAPDNQPPEYGPEDLLDSRQAAQVINRSITRITQLRASGDIPYVRNLGTNDYRYRYQDLINYVNYRDAALAADPNATDLDNLLLTREEAAEFIGLSVPRLRQLTGAGDIPVIRNPVTKTIRFRYSDLVAFKARRSIGVLERAGSESTERKIIPMDQT